MPLSHHIAGLSVALSCALLTAAPATAQSTRAPALPAVAAAVSGETTERLLSELRKKAAADDAATEASVGSGDPSSAIAPASDGSEPDAAPPRIKADGDAGDLPPQADPQDGVSAAEDDPGPVDGDLSADGTYAVPADAAASADGDAADAGSGARSNAWTTDVRHSARSAAARQVDATEEENVTSARQAAPAQGDADAAATDAPDPGADAPEPDAAAPPLRPPVVDLDDRPFDPVGYRVGGFRFLPTITSDTTWSDNVHHASSDPQGDWALVLRPGLAIESDWSRHSLSAEVSGVYGSHAEAASEDQRQLLARLRGRLDVTDLTSLEGEAGYELGQLQRGSIEAPSDVGALATTRTELIGGGIIQRINRLKLELRGDIASTTLDAGDGLSDGAVGDTYQDREVTFRAGYEVSPALTLFGTARRSDRVFGDTEASSLGSTITDLRLGLETDSSAKLSGSLSVGAAQISPSDEALASGSGLAFDASLVWLPSALTTWRAAAASTYEASTSGVSIGARVTTLSLDLRHEFRRYLALLAGVSETQRDYVGIDLTETETAGHLGLEYDLNREWALLGDYQHTAFSTSDGGSGYDEDLLTFGVRLQH